MSEFVVDVTDESFQREVLDASKALPVVVDFWAPWCGPCKVLKPVLEKLAAEYGGKFKLAKLNSDENPKVSAEYGIRSIPDVMAFRDGQPVSHFLGAVPESQVRAFIDALIPSPSEAERTKAAGLRQAGDLPAAIAALRTAIELDADNGRARLDLAEALIEGRQVDEAEALLDAVKPHIDHDERLATLRSAAAFARSAGSGASEHGLRDRLQKNPADHAARLALARLQAGAKRYQPALDELLEVVRRDRNFNDGEARREILAIFNLAADQPELVSAYRKKLASALN
jgi:putative thioredoxin